MFTNLLIISLQIGYEYTMNDIATHLDKTVC